MRWISASSEASCSAFGGRRDRVAIDAAVPEVMPGASAFFMSVAPACLQSSFVPAEAGIQRLSLERATGSPPSRGRQSLFSCQWRPPVCKAPSFPRKRESSVFRSNAPLGPRLRGDDEAFFSCQGRPPVCKAPSSRGSGNPASFARTRHWVPPSRGRQSFFSCQWRPPVCKAASFPRKREPASFARTRHWVPAFAGTTKPFFHVSGARLFAKLRRSRGSVESSVFRSNAPLGPRLRGADKAFFSCLSRPPVCKAASFPRKRDARVF